MAAHPFGPIEKFLITAYKKRGFDPRKVRPQFTDTVCWKYHNLTLNPLWAFFLPGHFEFRPNATYSRPGYEVSSVPSLVCLDLLSRGLGYRITFTMPADKEFNIQDPDTWPQIDIDVLDYLGEHILAHF